MNVNTLYSKAKNMYKNLTIKSTSLKLRSFMSNPGTWHKRKSA